MKYGVEIHLQPWMFKDEETQRRLNRNKIKEMLAEIMLEKVVPGKWYAVKMSIIEDKTWEGQYRIEVEANEIRQEVVRIPNLEERVLRPAATRREKLKNCIQYMKQKI